MIHLLEFKRKEKKQKTLLEDGELKSRLKVLMNTLLKLEEQSYIKMVIFL